LKYGGIKQEKGIGKCIDGKCFGGVEKCTLISGRGGIEIFNERIRDSPSTSFFKLKKERGERFLVMFDKLPDTVLR